ncbi:MAG: proton-conducting transporter membrane subunit [Bacillota bacterium]|nr:proton-conducting transporter membrane subunit [Bacillota bacterium]
MLDLIASFISSGLGANLLYTMIVIPSVLALVILLIPKRGELLRSALFLGALLLNAALSLGLLRLDDMKLYLPWAGGEVGINFALRVYNFSQQVIVIVAFIADLVGLYALSYLRKKDYSPGFLFYYLITLALVNGSLLANNLVVMLFFWEALLAVLFGMLILGNETDPKAAVKALVLNGIADLLLMLGIIITCYLAGTPLMSEMKPIALDSEIAVLGFVCMMLGALGKAGAMPFHSWIPDAAKAAPLPFMAIMPGALEKLLGTYLMIRVCFDFYSLQPGSAMSQLIMIIGAITLVLGGAMALIQKEMKKLLSFHAISQVGYIVLAVGTALPVGFVGALFHMVNNALFKSSLFLSAGIIETRTGTTDLRKIGGLGRFMPLTAIATIVCALSIAGVPPFNGFFSKELIFDAALESNIGFYIAALLGAFMTAASFLKFCHAAFFGPVKLPESVSREEVKEAPGAMLLPVLVLSASCLVFGVYNKFPLSYLQALFGDFTAGADFSGWPHSMTLVLISLAVLLLALLNHVIGYRVTGEGVKAVDHIHYAPVLRTLYDLAEKHYFDPYNISMAAIKLLAWICLAFDHCVNWIYDVFFVRIVNFVSSALHVFNSGSTRLYMAWAFSGVAFLILLFMMLH